MEEDLGSLSIAVTQEAMRQGTANAIVDALASRFRKVPGIQVLTAVHYDAPTMSYLVEAMREESLGRRGHAARLSLKAGDVYANADSTANWNNWMDYIARSFVREFLPTNRLTIPWSTSTSTGSTTNITYGNSGFSYGNNTSTTNTIAQYLDADPEESYNRQAKYTFDLALDQGAIEREHEEAEILKAQASIAESLKRLDQRDK